jgi:YL1 nuclear protein C-terminal domain
MKIAKNKKHSHIGGKQKYKTLRQAYSQLLVESPQFVSLFTRVGVEPQISLCDLTGLQARYVCPRTHLLYHGPEVYTKIRDMSMDTALAHAKIRALGKEFDPFSRRP